MNNNLIIIPTLLLVFLIAGENSNIQFQYGILLRQESKPDSIITLADQSVIHTGDEVRVNIGYPPGTYFYVIFSGTDGEYLNLYSEKSPEGDSLFYDTGFPWNDFTDPLGLETFYFINSNSRQMELENSFSRYEKAKGKIKKKLAKKIQGILDNLNPVNRDIDSFSSQLDEPLVGGVTFRGEDDDALKDLSLTHTCSGKNGIAIQKIVLNHQ